VNSSHHQVGGQQQRRTPGIGHHCGIVADPNFARWGLSSRRSLESSLQGSDYLEFTRNGSANIGTQITSRGVSSGASARATRPAWLGSNHAPCLAFNPLSTDYY
jgi:hypothetical protein